MPSVHEQACLILTSQSIPNLQLWKQNKQKHTDIHAD